MKTSKIFFSLFLILSIGLVSCEYEPLEGEYSDLIPRSPIGKFQVEMDGELWVADHVIGGRINLEGFHMMNIAATRAGESFNIMIDTSTAGTYNLADQEDGQISYVPDENDTSTAITQNQVTVNVTNINENNFTLNGTFQGLLISGQDTIVLTNGMFENVPYALEEETNPPGNGEEGYATALIDGEQFTATLVSAGLTDEGNAFAVMMADADYNTFNLWLPPNISADTSYPVVSVDTDLYPIATYMGLTEQFAYWSIEASGSITITSFDADTVEGTFEFDMFDMEGEGPNIEVTEGEFLAPIQ